MAQAYEDLVKEYRRLAKRADQRMVRLEQLSETDDMFKNVTKWAYAKAQKEMKRWGGEDATRFNTKPPENYQALLGKVNAINEFLQSPTSTKKGTVEVFKKRADIINSKYGTDFSWESLAKYYQSGLADKLSRYGYVTALKAVAAIQDKQEKVNNKIVAANSKIKTGDEVLDERIRDISKKYGKEIKAGLL